MRDGALTTVLDNMNLQDLLSMRLCFRIPWACGGTPSTMARYFSRRPSNRGEERPVQLASGKEDQARSIAIEPMNYEDLLERDLVSAPRCSCKRRYAVRSFSSSEPIESKPAGLSATTTRVIEMHDGEAIAVDRRQS